MTKARKPLGKRTRFDVFKRDHFTCQYCGAQPPDVVLVIDHVLPVAAGGGNEPENLVAACEGCNAGKADKSLAHVPVRPDADMMYLETQQELAELRRYHEAKRLRDEEMGSVVAVLQDYWCALSGLDWTPADHVLRNMLARHSPEAVEKAILVTAPKVASRQISKHSWPQYMWGVLNRIADEAAE